jgi:hypothetical protein
MRDEEDTETGDAVIISVSPRLSLPPFSFILHPSSLIFHPCLIPSAMLVSARFRSRKPIPLVVSKSLTSL